MTVVWIVVGLGVAGAMMAWVNVRRRRSGHADLGVVSNQWIAEQRVVEGPAPRR